jgi:small subunit ribosomal protein S5
MSNKYKNVELVKPSGLELKDRLVSVNRVTKVTKGGRASVCYCSCRWWKWCCRSWIRKSKDVSEAIAKAVEDAKKNLVKNPWMDQQSHEQKR